MRQLSSAGDAETLPHPPAESDHSSVAPERDHGAAFVGDAETKNCTQPPFGSTGIVRSNTTFVPKSDMVPENRPARSREDILRLSA